MAKKKALSNTIALNRRAKFDYEITDTYEAGIILTGSEVKSCRAGQVSINEAYAQEKDGRLYLMSAMINVYKPASQRNHEPTRPRELLLHRKELSKLFGALQKSGLTLIPTAMYFNNRGIAKVELGLGKGKTKYDKRETEKQRDWNRQKGKLLRENQ